MLVIPPPAFSAKDWVPWKGFLPAPGTSKLTVSAYETPTVAALTAHISKSALPVFVFAMALR
jgi:hypothetical protein